jgi:signal transduction histidine kinase
MRSFKITDLTSSPVALYTGFGIAFGLCFPVIAILFDIVFHLDKSISVSSILFVHQTNPLHFIIDTAPVFLGLAFGVAGNKQHAVLQLNKSLTEASNVLREKNEALKKALSELQSAKEKSLEVEKLAAFGVMATRVSHELQNPLNFINNFSDLSIELVEEFRYAKDDEQKNRTASLIVSNFEKIYHHGRRAEDIIRQLQESARTGNAHEFFEK